MTWPRLSADDYHKMAEQKPFLIAWVGDEVPKSNSEQTKWLCECGNVFSYKYSNMSRKTTGCRECRYKVGASKRRNGTEMYHELANISDGVKRWLGPEVNRVQYKTWWEFDCGHTNKTTYLDIHQGNRCPKCSSSKGEKMIAKFLSNNGIVYEQEKRFDQCRNKKPLPFDFYLPEHNLLIEYNGKQHYSIDNQFGNKSENEAKISLANIKRNDRIKEDWVRKTNGIRLLVISYKQFNQIESIILSEIV